MKRTARVLAGCLLSACLLVPLLSASAQGTGADGVEGRALPAAPSSPTVVAVNDGQLKFTWRDNSSTESGFKVTNGSKTWLVSRNETTFYRHLLQPHTKQCFRVAAYNGSGTSAYTTSVCATTPGRTKQQAQAWIQDITYATCAQYVYIQKCEKFVDDAYNITLRPSHLASAVAHYQWLKDSGLIKTGTSVPYGALAFFGGPGFGGSSYGHVVISTGDGWFWTTPYSETDTYGCVHGHTLSELEACCGSFRGWSQPIFNY